MNILAVHHKNEDKSWSWTQITMFDSQTETVGRKNVSCPDGQQSEQCGLTGQTERSYFQPCSWSLQI